MSRDTSHADWDKVSFKSSLNAVEIGCNGGVANDGVAGNVGSSLEARHRERLSQIEESIARNVEAAIDD